MGRTTRAAVGGVCYHVLNRGNGGAKVFMAEEDYDGFVTLLQVAYSRLPTRVLGYCLMPTHFHLVLWPRQDGDLSRWMQWLLTSHVRRHHRRYGSHGHVWQGRYKAFPIEQDGHLLTVLRYVDAIRSAGLVGRAEEWPWSSLRWWSSAGTPTCLDRGPVGRAADWTATVNQAQSLGELEALRRSVNRGAPWGDPQWARRTACRLGLESALRPRGRPRKEGAKK